MSSTDFLNDLELALLRGLQVRVTNVGRIDPSTEELRKKNGLSGFNDTVRVIPISKYTADPMLNPMYDATRRESYRLGDMLVDTRAELMQLPGR